MNLIKNTIVVPSTTPTPNQDSERVALFNEDGTPFSGGGGKKVIARAVHNEDVDFLVPETFGEGAYRGVDFSDVNWSGGTPYFDPDYNWMFSGDSSVTYYGLNWHAPGEFSVEMLPNKLYSWNISADIGWYPPGVQTVSTANSYFKVAVGAQLFGKAISESTDAIEVDYRTKFNGSNQSGSELSAHYFANPMDLLAMRSAFNRENNGHSTCVSMGHVANDMTNYNEGNAALKFSISVEMAPAVSTILDSGLYFNTINVLICEEDL